MEFQFLNKNLKTLYTTGKSRKYPLEKQVIHGFFEVMASINAAKDIHDLQKKSSLNFEKMANRTKRYSLRINRKYRLEVEIEWGNEEKTIGILGIDSLSNHYE